MVITGDERWDLELLRDATGYQRWIVDALGGGVHGEVVEVGAGIGNFTREIAPRAQHVVALEPEADLCEEIRALGFGSVEAVPRTVEASGLPPGSFDAAVLINVLEHIEDDVGALRKTFDLARPGGQVMVVVPAHPMLMGVLDVRYQHRRRYRKRDLAERLVAAGFRDVRVRYLNPIGAIGWFIVGRILRPTRLPAASVTLSERVAVPLGRFLERFGSPPFGQSVVGIASRPDVGK